MDATAAREKPAQASSVIFESQRPGSVVAPSIVCCLCHSYSAHIRGLQAASNKATSSTTQCERVEKAVCSRIVGLPKTAESGPRRGKENQSLNRDPCV